MQVGDRVVVHAGQWNLDDPWVTAGKDPGLAGASGCGGTTPAGARSRSSAKCRRTNACPKPTSSRGKRPPRRHSPVRPPTACCSAGRRAGRARRRRAGVGRERGLGSLAVQLVANAGGRAVAVVSSDEKGEVRGKARRGPVRQPQGLLALGRAAGLGRHGGGVSRCKAVDRDLGRARREGVAGIVFDHPGQDTIPTSIFVATAAAWW